ncbi:hypothetical protein OROHE_009601 [Orobanche hederae]
MVDEGIALGHKVYKAGLEVDESTIIVMKELPVPKDVTSLRSFLGYAGYYRRFIKDFSSRWIHHLPYFSMWRDGISPDFWNCWTNRYIPLSDPFSVDITKLTVGYLEDAETDVVQKLQSRGVNMVPFKLNYAVDSAQGILNFTMDVDMLAHFDEWQRSGLDDQYEAQDQWPVELRRARVIPAVDYVQAQRARGKLIQEVKDGFKVDAFIGNATDWALVCVGNLVGIPVIVVPTGFKPISDSPTDNTRRRSTFTTGNYAPLEHDHIGLTLHGDHAMFANKELQTRTVSSWKNWKLRHHAYVIRTSIPFQRTPLIHVDADEPLDGVSARIIQNNISVVSIMHSTNGSSPRLLHVACLSGMYANTLGTILDIYIYYSS